MPTGNIQPPVSHPDDAPTVCIEINEDWIPYLIGMVWPAKYPEYWGGTLDENRTARKDVHTLMSLIQAAMECGNMPTYCCVEPPIIYRTNQDTGNVEQSTDNGATWGYVSGGIQSVIVAPVPPVTSGVSATKCDAATNLFGQIDAWIDQVSGDFDTATTLLQFGEAVILAIVGAVLTILTAGALSAVEALILASLAAALYAAWGAGKAVFDAYWTTDIKDDILCAAVCNIGEDGSFSDAQFSGFWNEVNSKLPASPAKMLLMGFLSSVGKQGLNSMAASGLAADADCNDCTCGNCNLDNWAIKVFEGFPIGTEISRGDDYIIIEATLHPSFGQYVAQLQSNGDSTCCIVTEIEILSGPPEGTLYFMCLCGNPRWPAMELQAFDLGVSLNTFHARNLTVPYQIKVTFGE